uniref:Uncharacterized protein n=1 Tax=Timema cristinae TaxID=61476 RepID=A0A7R9D7A9_TIMCR|nr:unnamed protein product [Timema cristinae]
MINQLMERDCSFFQKRVKPGSLTGHFAAVHSNLNNCTPFMLISAEHPKKLGTLPSYLGWTRYLSWLMYSNEAMSIIQWEGVTNITCLNNLDTRCLVDGDDVLQKYSFKASNFWSDILGMSVLYAIFHILGYICILYRAKKR